MNRGTGTCDFIRKDQAFISLEFRKEMRKKTAEKILK